MERAIAIQTEIGIIRGRDAIFLDNQEENAENGLVFCGEINGILASNNWTRKQWIPYQLSFSGVIAFFRWELDTHDNMVSCGKFFFSKEYSSSFDRIEQSAFMEHFPIRKDLQKEQYSYYRLDTYDWIYHIIARDYEFKVVETEEKRKEKQDF